MPSDKRKRGGASTPARPSLRAPRAGKKQRRLGTRGAGFSAREIDALLRLLGERLPLAKEEWEDVAREHIERFPELDRTVDALRRKFSRLHRARADGGDADSLPRDTQAAKAVLEAMTRRADTTSGGGSGAYAALLSRNVGGESDENLDADSADDRFGAESPVSATEAAAAAAAIRQLEASDAPPPTTPAVCPRCGRGRPRSEYEDVMDMLRVSLLQMQQQREQDAADRRRRDEQARARREEERRRRDEDRAADRERMNSLVAMVAQSHQTVEMLVVALVKGDNSVT